MSKKVLIKGWRGISHSFAMVNQHHILGLLKHYPDMTLFHRDMPLLPKWSALGNSSGFAEHEQNLISALKDCTEDSVDVTFQICHPTLEPIAGMSKTMTFMVTETGMLKENFTTGNFVAKSAFTTGDNCIVAPSRWARERVLDYGFDPHKVQLLPHGVDTQLFSPLSDDVRDRNRTGLSFQEDDVVFLNVGAPFWNKGIDLLLLAFARVNLRYANTKLILKDSGALYGVSVRDQIKKIVASHPKLITEQFIKSVILLEANQSIHKMRALYDLADVYVSPYRAEGFNLPVLEAMAVGTPVIVTSGGATDDFCPSGLAGIHKIASVGYRGTLGGLANMAWHVPDEDALVGLMSQQVELGGKKGSHYAQYRSELVNQASQWSWEQSIHRLVALMDS